MYTKADTVILLIQNPWQGVAFASPFFLLFSYFIILDRCLVTRTTLILFTIILPVFCVGVPLAIYIYLARPYDSFYDNLAMSLAINVLGLFGGFYGIEYYFRKAWAGDHDIFNKKMKPEYNSENVFYFKNIKSAKIISFISRYTILCLVSVGGFVTFLGGLFETFNVNISVDFGANIFLATVVLFCINTAFLRCVVRCPHCSLEIFFIDQMLHSHFEVAKRAIKDNVLECWHCHAAYALDPKMDLDQLREDNVKNWDERMEKKRILEEKRKASQ